MASSPSYEFGEFRLDSEQNLLFRDGELVPLTPKTIEILLLLVEHHGRVVDKAQLMQQVWPDTFVEEGSLTRNISVLRKTLANGNEGNEYIETIPKRGYRFVAPVAESQPESQPQLHLQPAPVPSPSQDSRSQTRTVIIALAAVTALLLTTLAWRFTASEPAMPFSARNWVLITDFENRTGEPRFDNALLTAFTVSLEQSRHANVFPRSSASSTLQRMGQAADARMDESLGREVCQREGIRGLVSTSITRAGKKYAITAKLVDPTSGFSVASHEIMADSEERVLDSLDLLAFMVRRDLGESLYSIRASSEPLPRVTTSSLRALELYSQANHEWSNGKWDQALQEYLAAVQIDPDFAMAHAALGASFYSHIYSDPKQGQEHFEKALQSEGRITARERALVEASYQAAAGHSEMAERLYTAYISTYPDDVLAQTNLANIYLSQHRFDEAIARYKDVLQINPNNSKADINLATAYAMQGRYSEALPYYEAAFQLEPSWIVSANLNHEYGFSLAASGSPDKARQVFNDAIAKGDKFSNGLRSIALLDMFEGKYNAAADHLAQYIRTKTNPGAELNRARGYQFEAQVFEMQRKPRQLLAALDSAMKELHSAQQTSLVISSRIGVAYARSGALHQAEGIAQSWEGKVDAQNRDQSSDFHRLQGEIELARGNAKAALTELEQALQLKRDPLTIESLAHTYVKKSQPDQAIPLYAELIDMKGGWVGWEAQQCWLLAHVELAKLYMERKDAQHAAPTLTPLLHQWSAADKNLPAYRSATQMMAKTVTQ